MSKKILNLLFENGSTGLHVLNVLTVDSQVALTDASVQEDSASASFLAEISVASP